MHGCDLHNTGAADNPPRQDDVCGVLVARHPVGQFAPGELGSGQFAPGELGSGQFAPGELVSGQFAPGELGSGQFAPGELGSASVTSCSCFLHSDSHIFPRFRRQSELAQCCLLQDVDTVTPQSDCGLLEAAGPLTLHSAILRDDFESPTTALSMATIADQHSVGGVQHISESRRRTLECFPAVARQRDRPLSTEVHRRRVQCIPLHGVVSQGGKPGPEQTSKTGGIKVEKSVGFCQHHSSPGVMSDASAGLGHGFALSSQDMGIGLSPFVGHVPAIGYCHPHGDLSSGTHDMSSLPGGGFFLASSCYGSLSTTQDAVKAASRPPSASADKSGEESASFWTLPSDGSAFPALSARHGSDCPVSLLLVHAPRSTCWPASLDVLDERCLSSL